MFGLFKKRKKSPGERPGLVDMNQQPLAVGDRVEAFRYDLGISTIVEVEGVIYYQSEANGTLVIWVKMIDAATKSQKVKKLAQD